MAAPVDDAAPKLAHVERHAAGMLAALPAIAAAHTAHEDDPGAGGFEVVDDRLKLRDVLRGHCCVSAGARMNVSGLGRPGNRACDREGGNDMTKHWIGARSAERDHAGGAEGKH